MRASFYVAARYLGSPVSKQEVSRFSRLSIDRGRLNRANKFPVRDCLSNESIYGLPKRGAGLVDWHVQQADAPIGGNSGRPLRTSAADTEPTDLVDTQTSEEPDYRQGLNHGERIVVFVHVGSRAEIGLRQVDSSPQQLCPNIISDDPWFRPDQRAQAARRRE